MVATVANVTQMFFGVSTSAKSQIESGALRGLAVSTSQRSVLLPALPTMIESGYPTFNMPGWGGLLATAGTRKDIVEKLNADFYREDLKENEHIGLANVNQRIQLMFGRKYGLKIQSEWKRGTLVVITFPKLEQ